MRVYQRQENAKLNIKSNKKIIENIKIKENENKNLKLQEDLKAEMARQQEQVKEEKEQANFKGNIIVNVKDGAKQGIQIINEDKKPINIS